MNKKQKLQTKFNNTLKLFSNQLEESKIQQEQILENFELTLDKDNENLKKLTEQIQSKEETMAIIQNALNNTNQQLQFRDEALKLTQAEVKEAETTIKSLVKTHREYVNDIHYKIDR